MKYEYCPNGNYWKDVSGIFDTETFFFCDCSKCNGKMYALKVRDVTKKIDQKVIQRVRDDAKLKKVRCEVNKSNMDKVDQFIKSSK